MKITQVGITEYIIYIEVDDAGQKKKIELYESEVESLVAELLNAKREVKQARKEDKNKGKK